MRDSAVRRWGEHRSCREHRRTASERTTESADECLHGGVIDFLTSNAGIYTTATAGLLFQLVGVVLVVRDLMQRHGIARRFTNNMNAIENAHCDLQEIPRPSGPGRQECSDRIMRFAGDAVR